MKTVYVVIICEMDSAHVNEVDAEVFSEYDDAVQWVEREIAEKTQTYHLDASVADGGYVEIDGPTHAIQYDIRERTLR